MIGGLDFFAISWVPQQIFSPSGFLLLTSNEREGVVSGKLEEDPEDSHSSIGTFP